MKSHIFGSAGFIGSHLLDKLRENYVVCLDNIEDVVDANLEIITKGETGSSSKIVYTAPQKGDSKHTHADIRKAKKELR